MKKDVTKKPETEVAVKATLDDWGVPEVSSNDILIPKILVMQGLSELLAEGHAQIGEFRDSVNGDLLGSIDKPVEIIPFHCDKVWIISKKVQGQGRHDYVETVPVTRENEDWLWQEMDSDGTEIRRDRTMNFYCLLPKHIEEGGAMPYIVSFNRTSSRNGKKLFTQMFITNRQAGKVPPAKVISLFGKREKNDQGTFIVKDVKTSRDSTVKEVNACFDLYKMVQAGKTKVDNTDVSGGSVSDQF